MNKLIKLKKLLGEFEVLGFDISRAYVKGTSREWFMNDVEGLLQYEEFHSYAEAIAYLSNHDKSLLYSLNFAQMRGLSLDQLDSKKLAKIHLQDTLIEILRRNSKEIERILDEQEGDICSTTN